MVNGLLIALPTSAAKSFPPHSVPRCGEKGAGGALKLSRYGAPAGGDADDDDGVAMLPSGTAGHHDRRRA